MRHGVGDLTALEQASCGRTDCSKNTPCLAATLLAEPRSLNRSSGCLLMLYDELIMWLAVPLVTADTFTVKSFIVLQEYYLCHNATWYMARKAM